MNAPALRDLLRRRQLHLSRDLGQNFLIDEPLADRLVAVAGVEGEDAVVEIGTGLGCLTRALAARAARVVTVEVDSGLVRALQEEDLLPPEVTLIHADALKLDLREQCERLGPRVRVVANLPYSVATPLLRRLLGLCDVLSGWSVMLQSEVAERVTAPCGSKEYGSFSVLHELCVDARIELTLSPKSFFPVPNVSSAFVRFEPLKGALLRVSEIASVERVVRAAFGKRRKTIFNSIRQAGLPGPLDAATLRRALESAGIESTARAEKVPADRLLQLARELAPYTGVAN